MAQPRTPPLRKAYNDVNPSLEPRIAMDPRPATGGAELPPLRAVANAASGANATRLRPSFLRKQPASEQDAAALDAELRQRCLPILFWSACIFNALYVAWGGFDYLLAPEHFRYFMSLRLIAAAFNTALVVAVHRAQFQRFVWEAFWLWSMTKGLFIALMLAVVDESSYMAYVLGYTVIIYGAGLLPYWPPRWAVSVMVPMVALPALRLVMGSSRPASRELIAGGFVVLTSAGLSLIIAFFKYSLAKRDFLARRALSELAQRERDARLDLDHAGAALRSALTQLKEMDRLKSQFFANISHELRTPLTLILSPLEKSRAELGDSPAGKSLDVVRRNAERLLRLIDDLLELSRLDAGGLRLHLSEVDLRALAGTVYENAMAAAQSRSVHFEFDSDPHVRRIHGDAHRLEIVLTNLISNALKFTPNGGSVVVRVQSLEEGVQVDVRDSGPGIAEQDLPHVFERFFQVLRSDRRRQQGGVGIGLALARELVDLHGGRIWVRSELSKGSVFSVFFPYGRDHIRPEVIERRARVRGVDAAESYDGRSSLISSLPPETKRATSAPPAEEPVFMRGKRRARVVLAEDQEELRAFIAELLRPDYDVFVAEDGAAALALVRRERPDLVISDVMMPNMSGAQLCAVIKSDAQLRNTPIILLTARVGAEATLEGYAHGADDFVPKPFHPRVLQARVRAQLMLRRMALDLAEREKLAAVGTLSAGILHEVRNPVNAIINAARVLSDGPTDSATARRLLSVVADCAGRIHQLTQSLDAHARPENDGAACISDVTEGLDATLALLSHRLHAVDVVRSYRAKTLVRAPAGPLNQIILNLLDNALLAGAKTLRISVEADAELVHVAIADDGAGVPTELRERIFDAFVSGSIKGSGLGLYLSRCIAEQYGGSLKLADEPLPCGAAFVLTLPREVSRE